MTHPYKVVSYITDRYDEILPEKLDLSGITHVNYGFLFLRADDVFVRRPEFLELVSKTCKEQGVKLLASLQQWGGQRFDERCRTEEARRTLAAQVREVVDKYGLDGIDVDWEYPGYNLRTGEEIADFKDEYYILFMQALRDVLPGKLLTIAHGGEPRYWQHTNFASLHPILDYINLMGYDFNWPTLGSSHQSNLYPGSVGAAAEECRKLGVPGLSDDAAIRYYRSQGVPAEKINIGVPYYGYVAHQGPEGYLTYDKILELLETDPHYRLEYDEAAHQSYVTKDGVFHIAFDDERTLAEKCRYVKENGLGGIMDWVYGHDPKGQARKIVARELGIT